SRWRAGPACCAACRPGSPTRPRWPCTGPRPRWPAWCWAPAGSWRTSTSWPRCSPATRPAAEAVRAPEPSRRCDNQGRDHRLPEVPVRQRVIAGVAVLALIGLVFALNFYRLPVVALSPGPMEDVLTRLKIQGSKVYDSEGKLYLTSVGIDDNVRFYEALLDMANHDVQLYPRAQLYPEQQDSAEIDE